LAAGDTWNKLGLFLITPALRFVLIAALAYNMLGLASSTTFFCLSYANAYCTTKLTNSSNVPFFHVLEEALSISNGSSHS
jgi:hypothetical protein